MHGRTSAGSINLVLQGGCNAVANQPAEIVTAVGAAAVLLDDEPASSALRVKRVPARTLHLSNINAHAAIAAAVERNLQQPQPAEPAVRPCNLFAP